LTAPTGAGRHALRAVAWGAVIASFPIWIAAFAVAPFLPLRAGERAAVAAGCIAVGEALFWIAGFYLGADVLARFRTPKVTTGRSLRGRRVVVVVANFVLQAVLAKRPVAVMGAGTQGRGDAGTRGRGDAGTRGRGDAGTRALARLHGALPWLGHAIVVRFLGKALRSRFSRAST
jgi:hypothetical protein